MNILDFDGSNGIDLLLAVQEFKPEVVILLLLENGLEPGVCSHLREEFEDIAIITISPSQIRSFSKVFVVPYSESALLETIRESAGHSTAKIRGAQPLE